MDSKKVSVFDDLARQALAEFPNDWPEAERLLRERILSDDELLRAIATPLITVAVHERIVLYGRMARQQTTRDAIEAAEALVAIGGDTDQLVNTLHTSMEGTPWHPNAIKRKPSLIGLLGMGVDDREAILDRYTLQRGKRLGDATRADLDEEIQMRRQHAKGTMQPVRWFLLLKKRLKDDTQQVRDVMNNTTALQLLAEAERMPSPIEPAPRKGKVAAEAS